MYCNNKCRAWASIERRKDGTPPPAAWQHPALQASDPVLHAAAQRAQQLGEANGWSASTIRCTIDGLSALLTGRASGQRVAYSEIRARTGRHTSTPRVAEVLADLGLLDDEHTTPAIRSWIDHRAGELPAGFASSIQDWLLVLLDGDARARPRSHSTLYVYFGIVRPIVEHWAAERGHLREITGTDVTTALDQLRGWRRRNAIAALRSLFRFAKRRGIVFANPTARLKTENIDRSLLPMTDAEIRAVEQVAASPAQRLIVALSAVHATRPEAIRNLLLDEIDLPNRRITLTGHTQRLGDLTYRTMQAWLDQRRATWPHTPNRHVLISQRTALGTEPISKSYLKWHLQRHGVNLERIRGDRILHEALTVGPDPLHLSLVFNLSHTTATRYAALAEQLLDGQLEHGTEQ